ncbi:MAG TPA: AAA family ATPase [Blastocatellia bacterium]|nr:AAA family ATPase [Blastocatellia bacterium]
MISKITVENFKSHARTEIEPGRVTALVGPNGCGKTSLLQAVYFLNQFIRQIVNRGSWVWDMIHQFTRKGQSNDSLSISVIGPDNSWGLKIEGSQVLDLQSRHEITPELLKSFGEVSYFKALAQSVSSPSYTLDIPPVIGADGSFAASVIGYLKNYQEEIHERIAADLRQIVPPVKRIRVHPVSKLIKEKRTISVNGNTIPCDEDRTVVAHELIFDTKSGDSLPASMISEGTLVTLALLTLLHTSDAELFLLDDVEQALHPLAQRELMQTLKKFVEKQNKQIILTSHSPYIVDELDAENVWVMATDSEGISHTRRLSEHPDAKRGLEVLTTGEFLSAEGESWVTDNGIPVEQVNA